VDAPRRNRRFMDTESVTRLTARELSGFHGLHRFSAIPNTYNKPGNLLSLKQQGPRMEQLGFGHSSGTLQKQGR